MIPKMQGAADGVAVFMGHRFAHFEAEVKAQIDSAGPDRNRGRAFRILLTTVNAP